MLSSPFDYRFVLLVVASLTTLVVAQIGSLLSPSWIWAALAVLVYCVFCWRLPKFYPAAFILFLWFIFLRFTTMVSGLAIETGAYMPEIKIMGEPTGAFIRLGMVYIIAFTFALLLINALIKYLPRPSEAAENFVSKWAYPVFGLTALVAAGIFMIGVKHGFPLIEGIDRIVYWRTVSSRFLDAFISNRIIFSVLLGMIFCVCTGLKRTMALGIFCGLIFLSVLFAEKFTSLCMMLIYFITPGFFLRPETLSKVSKRVTFIAVAIPALTLPFILLAYGIDENPEAALERFKARAASQAQLWYLADTEDHKMFQLKDDKLRHNVRAMLSTTPDDIRKSAPYIGAADFMAEYMEEDRYSAYRERGVSLTLGMEGYLVKLFGTIGMLPVYVALVAMFCGNLVYLAYGITSLNPLRVFAAAKLWVWSDYGLKQGYLYSMIGLKSVAFMIVILAVEIGVRLVFKKHNHHKEITRSHAG